MDSEMVNVILTQFVQTNATIHLDYLKKQKGFPKSCSVSSEFIASYLHALYPDESVELVYGTFGKEDFYHCWVEWDNQIFDFTMFQFLVNKERGNFYKKMTGSELLDYIHSLQSVVIFDKNFPLYRTLFKKVAVIKPEFSEFVGPDMDYQKYLSRVNSSEKFKNYINSSPVLISGEDYNEYIHSQGKQKKYNRSLGAWTVK